MLVKEPVVMIYVQGLVPIFIDVIGPVEFSLNDPSVLLPSHDGRFSRDNVIVEQAAIEPVAFVIGNQVGI